MDQNDAHILSNCASEGLHTERELSVALKAEVIYDASVFALERAGIHVHFYDGVSVNEPNGEGLSHLIEFGVHSDPLYVEAARIANVYGTDHEDTLTLVGVALKARVADSVLPVTGGAGRTFVRKLVDEYEGKLKDAFPKDIDTSDPDNPWELSLLGVKNGSEYEAMWALWALAHGSQELQKDVLPPFPL